MSACPRCGRDGCWTACDPFEVGYDDGAVGRAALSTDPQYLMGYEQGQMDR